MWFATKDHVVDHVVDETLQERNIKKIFACESHFSEDQLLKLMYKIITSLFLQKLPQRSRNSERQPNYKISKKCLILFSSSSEQFYKNRNLKFDQTL